jgi:hypothetical protein
VQGFSQNVIFIDNYVLHCLNIYFSDFLRLHINYRLILNIVTKPVTRPFNNVIYIQNKINFTSHLVFYVIWSKTHKANSVIHVINN